MYYIFLYSDLIKFGVGLIGLAHAMRRRGLVSFIFLVFIGFLFTGLFNNINSTTADKASKFYH